MRTHRNTPQSYEFGGGGLTWTDVDFRKETKDKIGRVEPSKLFFFLLMSALVRTPNVGFLPKPVAHRLKRQTPAPPPLSSLCKPPGLLLWCFATRIYRQARCPFNIFHWILLPIALIAAENVGYPIAQPQGRVESKWQNPHSPSIAGHKPNSIYSGARRL